MMSALPALLLSSGMKGSDCRGSAPPLGPPGIPGLPGRYCGPPG